MPYNIKIQNEQGEDIGGLITFQDSDGDNLGESVVPVGGADLDQGIVGLMFHYWVTSPGYSRYGGVALFEDGNLFTLSKSSRTALYVALAAVGGFIMSRLIKL